MSKDKKKEDSTSLSFRLIVQMISLDPELARRVTAFCRTYA